MPLPPKSPKRTLYFGNLVYIQVDKLMIYSILVCIYSILEQVGFVYIWTYIASLYKCK